MDGRSSLRVPGTSRRSGLSNPTLAEVIRTVGSDAEAQVLLEELVEDVRSRGSRSGGANIVAFSGGVDSSLTAFLVLAAFGSNFSVLSACCIGISPALASWQLENARAVADQIGIQLWEVDTREGDLPEYVANEGQSCFHCKTTLYGTLQAVGERAVQGLLEERRLKGIYEADSSGTASEVRAHDIVLFNGTNADDLKDPTRLGLLAAASWQVESPLCSLPKETVRALARVAGLPNHALAASPCLRSRLQYGVGATPLMLRAVERMEREVRKTLELKDSENLRMRIQLPRENPQEILRKSMPDTGMRSGSSASEYFSGIANAYDDALDVVLEVDSNAVFKAELCREKIDAVVASCGLRFSGIQPFRSGRLSHAALQN